MADYARLLATAQRLITKNGAACKWVVYADGVVDPTKPHRADTVPVAPVEKPVSILFDYDGSSGLLALIRAAGLEVPESVAKGYMPGGLGFTPTDKDKVKLPDNSIMIPQQIIPLAPGGIVLLYSIVWKS